MGGALKHIRVLDLTRVLAGPWCTQMLADLGADVIKVERPQTGDDTRHWGPPWVGDKNCRDTMDSAYFTSANRNKRSVAIDISLEKGQDILRELAKKVDVVVENYKVGTLSKYGLSYSDLIEINPSIIYCSITGYGQDGPYAHRPGYDFIFQAEGGLMSITGERDDKAGGGPMKTSIAVTDVLAGLNATVGILAALENRRETGEGQHIDIALLDTIVNFGANQIASYFMSGAIPKRWGNEHPNLAPYQLFKTADRPIIIGCGNDNQFKRLCVLLGREDLAGDPAFTTMSSRTKNRERLTLEIENTLTERSAEHWLRILEDSDVPTGSINNYKEVFDHPQVKHRKLRVDIPHSAGQTVGTVANPVRLSKTPVEYRHAPPQRGQHTSEVLVQMLSLSDEEIRDLQKERVIEVGDNLG